MSSKIEPIDDDTITERTEELWKVLNDLSVEYNEDDLKDVLEGAALGLVRVYADGYRQMYSQLYLMLDSISGGDEYYLTALLENLESLRKHVKKQWRADNGLENKKYPSYLYGCLIKLSDHLSLEYQRYVETEGLRYGIEDMREEMKNAQESLEMTRNNIKNTRIKVQKMQIEIVTILAIFAAIIMAFAGGLSFMGNALAGMNGANPYKISFVILLCGIIMFNVISYLLYAVNKIVTDFHVEEDEADGFRRFLVRSEFKHWFVVMFNVMLLIMLAITLLLWHFHMAT